jgi:hypothetical protein
MLGDLKSFEEKDRADRELAAKMSVGHHARSVSYGVLLTCSAYLQVVKKSGLASLSKASDSSSHVDMIRPAPNFALRVHQRI